jgi:DNA-binding protein H-NS
MATYKELEAELVKLKARAEEVRKQELGAVMADIKQKIADYGITAADLGFPARGREAAKPKHAIPPKYRNPQTQQTWSGRGRPPAWISEGTRERFLIK